MFAAIGIFFLLGYLIGSVNFAVLVAKKHGVDILKEGSGNPGAFTGSPSPSASSRASPMGFPSTTRTRRAWATASCSRSA